MFRTRRLITVAATAALLLPAIAPAQLAQAQTVIHRSRTVIDHNRDYYYPQVRPSSPYVVRRDIEDSTLVRPVIIDSTIEDSTIVNP